MKVNDVKQATELKVKKENRSIRSNPLKTLPLSKGLQPTYYHTRFPSHGAVKCAAGERTRDL